MNQERQTQKKAVELSGDGAALTELVNDLPPFSQFVLPPIRPPLMMSKTDDMRQPPSLSRRRASSA